VEQGPDFIGIKKKATKENTRRGATRNDCFAIREVAQRKHPKGCKDARFCVSTLFLNTMCVKQTKTLKLNVAIINN